METKPLFYSLYQITLEVTEKTYTNSEKSSEDTLEKKLEEITTCLFDSLTHLRCQRSFYKNSDQYKYFFPKAFKYKDVFFNNIEDENSFLNDLQSFSKDVSMQEIYIFKYKRTFFVLLVGKTIILSGWHKKISQTFHKIINQIRISNKLKNLFNIKPEICFSSDFEDYTYSQATKNPRRLRSLGGGLRRLLLNVRKNDKSLTNKKIIENLAYFTLSGDDKKLVTQISAVENNTKFNYQIEIKDINSNHLPPVQCLLQKYKKCLLQKYKKSNPNEIKKFIRQLEYCQKEMIQEIKKC